MDILIPAINQATCTKTIDSGDMIVSSGMDAASMKKITINITQISREFLTKKKRHRSAIKAATAINK